VACVAPIDRFAGADRGDNTVQSPPALGAEIERICPLFNTPEV
jgi:hypothetical protein